jgi:hypothetical protein
MMKQRRRSEATCACGDSFGHGEKVEFGGLEIVKPLTPRWQLGLECSKSGLPSRKYQRC